MVAVRRRKSVSEEERMTDHNLQRVIDLLEPSEEGKKPITKKEACEMLGMSYNTTRLAGILTDFKAKQERDKARRAAKKGKPADASEIVYAIEEYMKGTAVDSISDSLHRTAGFVKKILEDNAVPIRVPGHDYMHPQLIPDDAVRERFTLGEVVYAARYDSTALIKSEQMSPKHGWIYSIWLLKEDIQQFAYQPAYELASLEHLRKLGVKV